MKIRLILFYHSYSKYKKNDRSFILEKYHNIFADFNRHRVSNWFSKALVIDIVKMKILTYFDFRCIVDLYRPPFHTHPKTLNVFLESNPSALAMTYTHRDFSLKPLEPIANLYMWILRKLNAVLVYTHEHSAAKWMNWTPSNRIKMQTE